MTIHELIGCSSSQSQRIVRSMRRRDGKTHCFLPTGIGAITLILIVCLCVVSQMLGAPVTLLGLLTQDTPVESLSEDFSIPPSTPELGSLNRSRFTAESQSLRRIQVFSTAVFHPPQG